MLKTPRRRLRSRALAGCLAAAAAGGLAMLPATASQAASPAGTVASGADWSVTRAAGGYTVTLRLPTPLPVRDAAPDLVADGADIGSATESADGTTLTLTTSSAAVAAAKTVTWQWSTGGQDTGSTGSSVLPKASKLAASERPDVVGTADSDDPLSVGTGGYKVSDYDFGAQSLPLTDIGGIRGELQGRIYLPTASGAHPLVIFMHGRHSACYNVTTLKGVSQWPCLENSTDPTKSNYSILSYAGYDGEGEALAADGFTVVSISVNAINANDNQLSPDDGAASRGQAVLDTLTMLQKANAGQDPTYFDAATNTSVDLNQALVQGAKYDGTSGGKNKSVGAIAQTLTASDLVGTMDFSDIGVMGHSRGGEGAVTAATLNEGLAHPWNIKSVFALAPIDFTRDTLPDVATATLLPYCDGDVSDQQGQHFYADSRGAFQDNVLRSDIWVMGTDHDFYNTAWTPPYPGASDDWSSPNDAVCGASSPTTTRLSPTQQATTGSAYVAGWFQLTLGGQSQFQGMFDGSGLEPTSVSSFADVRTVAQQPASMRDDITNFASTSSLVGTSGTATAKVCASDYGRTVPEALPSCTTAAIDALSGAALTSQQQPYWTPASFAPNVPLNPMTDLTWTSGTGALSVTVPTAKRNVSSYAELSLTMSPDQGVTTGTDMTLSVSDAAGHSWSAPVSSLNPWAVNRMPGSDTTTGNKPTNLHKLVLQQVDVPTATIAAAGVDLTKVAQIKLTAGVGLDGTPAGGVFLSDLTFDSKGVGTPVVETWPTVNVASTRIEEGSGPGTADVAVYLSKAATKPVTAYLSMIGSATGKVGLAMQKVTFSPGQTCQAVTVPTTGDSLAGTAATTSYKVGVSNSSNAVLGAQDFGTVTVREDDGVTGTAVAAPAVGQQGDVCHELAAQSAPGALSVTPAPTAGATVTVTGAGFRAGESVALSLGDDALGTATATDGGTISTQVTIPADTAAGEPALTAVGAGSADTSQAVLDLRSTSDDVTLTPSAPAFAYGMPVTGTVTVAGATGGSVAVSSGSVTTTVSLDASGSAAYSLAALPVGSDTIAASYAGSDTLAPRSTTATTTVTEAATTVAVTKAQSKAHRRVLLTVVVGGRGAGSAITGKVVVNAQLGKRHQIFTGHVTASGTVRIAMKLRKKGTAKLVVTYLGDGNYAPSSAVSRTVRVRR